MRRVETHLSPPGGFIGAYYIWPNEDFSRPGTVWFAVGGARDLRYLFRRLRTYADTPRDDGRVIER